MASEDVFFPTLDYYRGKPAGSYYGSYMNSLVRILSYSGTALKVCIQGMVDTAHVAGFLTFGVGSAAIGDHLFGDNRVRVVNYPRYVFNDFDCCCRLIWTWHSAWLTWV